VLVVDDEPAVRFTLREVLEAHEVTLAASGEEALSILSERDEPFDAILTDLAMPRMTGLEFIAHLAVDHPEIPVLMLTAHGSGARGRDRDARGSVGLPRQALRRRRAVRHGGGGRWSGRSSGGQRERRRQSGPWAAPSWAAPRACVGS
jgi:CheY-like chemotaxis protein